MKQILGLADLRPDASTFVCVRLCSEGKIAEFGSASYCFCWDSRPFTLNLQITQ